MRYILKLIAESISAKYLITCNEYVNQLVNIIVMQIVYQIVWHSYCIKNCGMNIDVQDVCQGVGGE